MTRFRSRTIALLLLSTAALTGTPGNARTVDGPLHGKATIMDRVAASIGWTAELPAPQGRTPEERAAWIMANPTLGRSPQAWIDWTHASFDTDVTGVEAGSPASGDLVANVLRIYSSVGLPASPVITRAVADAAVQVPTAVRAPFADLVGVVAGAYEAQMPIARAVAARITPDLDPKTPLLAQSERDAMTASQARIVDAINVFRVRTAPYFRSVARNDAPTPDAGGTDAALFTDPEGLVILGGLGNATYTRSGLIPDPVLLVEPAGSDLYLNSAGGACPVSPGSLSVEWLQCNKLAVSVVADIGVRATGLTNDEYLYNGVPAAVQGAGGPGGIGILVDAWGDDRYLGTMTRSSAGSPFMYYFDGGAQGYGGAGAGLLLDGWGDDVYDFKVASTGSSIWAFAQGWGGAGGIGIASDAWGDDQWLSAGLGGVDGNSFQGLYTDGSGMYAGVGIMTDTGLGNDIYRATLTASTPDFYAQGFGAFGGLGIMVEDGGDDDYYTYQHGTSPWIDPLLNCAFGTASYAGIGIMNDIAGNDTYYGESHSDTSGAFVMDNGYGGPALAYGLFTDTAGNDSYTMVARAATRSIIEGRGYFEGMDHNTFGTFVDIGGNDTYVGGHGSNNAQWPFGVDRGA